MKGGRSAIPVLAAGLTLTLAFPAQGAELAPQQKQRAATVIDTKNPEAINLVPARIETDGFLTPGAQETITFSRMPKKTEFFAAVSRSFLNRTCAIRCSVSEIKPPPGDAPFGLRTDSHGRATVTFTMPTTYQRTLRTKSGKVRNKTVPYKHGDAVFVLGFAFRFRHKKATFAFPLEEDVVFFPPPP